MVTYFHYERKQRKTALILLMNAVLCLAIFFALHHYLPTMRNHVSEALDIINIAIWPIEFILLALATYFFRANKAVTIWISPKEFYYFDPTFGDFEWRVPVADIVAFKQSTDTRGGYLNHYFILKSGESKSLTLGNHHIDKRAFIEALKKANPAMEVPDNPYRYKSERPAWARRLLGIDKDETK
jgi:hypothetical protein